MEISTKKLENLIEIKLLKELCKSIAVLEAIICRDWEFRYYSYQSDWDKESGEGCMQMRNGSGDQFFIFKIWSSY